MFNEKQNTLFEIATIKSGSKASAQANVNSFLQVAMKESAKTLSGNGSSKFQSTGNAFVDQFSFLGSYKAPRTYADIAKDMSILWGENPEKAVKFTLYMRMITRKVQLFDETVTETVQRGAGLKHESIMRMVWLYQKDRNIFWKNIYLFVAVGSWKDVIQMLKYDVEYHGWDNKVLNWNSFRDLLFAGLENPITSELIKKYLPQIKSRSKCTTLSSQSDTIIGKWIASTLNLDYKGYRKLKTSGSAHKWQQLISQGKHVNINFDTIHGRALALLVSGKYITNNKLEDKYLAWIESKPVAKFTGYVHELFKDLNGDVGGSRGNMKLFQAITINKQFDGLVELGRTNAVTESGLIVVRDTSCSMNSIASGTNMSSNAIGKALALYFSAFLDGKFKDAFIEFSSSAKLHTWKGSTAVEKWKNDSCEAYGGTNFMSVAALICEIKGQGVPEKDFPTGILCVSDGEFNPSALNKTNVDSFKDNLRDAGFSDEYVDNFKIVLWNIQNSYYGRNSGKKFETHGDVKNVFYFSGYEASTVAFLTGMEGKTSENGEPIVPQNAAELFEAAMDQEVLNMVEL